MDKTHIDQTLAELAAEHERAVAHVNFILGAQWLARKVAAEMDKPAPAKGATDAPAKRKA